MKKLSIIIATVSLGLASCSSSPPNPSALLSPGPSPGISPAPSPGAATTALTPTPVASTPPVKTVPISGLIPSIDPALRRKEIAKGRQDPFTNFTVQKEQQVKPRKQPVSINVGPRTVANHPPIPPGGTAFNPSTQPNSRPTPPPGPPAPDLANATLISGVITIGNSIKVVVKAPNENTSRYVQPGQFISNGKVLLKRVENPTSSMPIIVLEENGQEVYKKIGQAITAQPKTPTQPGAGILFGE